MFIPPWMDKSTLCQHICCSDTTIDTWVVQGILPPPRKRGGKLMWKWSEVDEKLTIGNVETPDARAEEIRRGTQQEARAPRH